MAVCVELVGSSPRGRGTRAPGERPRKGRRFIPARAGNARHTRAWCSCLPVHPRAGGERLFKFVAENRGAGSSPRGRGTLKVIRLNSRQDRFIPARAGNALRTTLRRRRVTVHPRAGGERDAYRFIPARAGNARFPGLRRRPATVHPRAGGERVFRLCPHRNRIGSSPRGRGTPPSRLQKGGVVRFIPARAGNAPSGETPDSTPPVHPRAGGERRVPGIFFLLVIGSSPRGRGTHPPRRCGADGDRFIPARAGNAGLRGILASDAPVHPRAGGERYVGPALGGEVRRFIPARAGNAPNALLLRMARSVHPRAGGERASTTVPSVLTAGSSPRGRGTPVAKRWGGASVRFIPARAGNAGTHKGAGGKWSVHPRAGGERGMPTNFGAFGPGSSPRGRGTQNLQTPCGFVDRFIPARAGNAARRRRYRRRCAVHPRAGGERNGATLARLSSLGSSPRGRGTLMIMD